MVFLIHSLCSNHLRKYPYILLSCHCPLPVLFLPLYFVLLIFTQFRSVQSCLTLCNPIALTRQTFVDKVMSLLFNMLSRLVITFLPRSKSLLISWLQSPSAVILEPRKIKSATVSTVPPSISHEVLIYNIYFSLSDLTSLLLMNTLDFIVTVLFYLAQFILTKSLTLSFMSYTHTTFFLLLLFISRNLFYSFLIMCPFLATFSISQLLLFYLSDMMVSIILENYLHTKSKHGKYSVG